MSSTTTIAVDVGGTKTAIAAVSLPDLRIERRTELATPSGPDSGQAFLDLVSRQAGEMARETAAEAIGVSLCELVGNDGQVTSAHRVRWKGLRVQAAFARHLMAAIDSDVRAGAVAEARFGAGRGFREILYVNIGTGVSSCWIKDGRVHRGSRGNALVLANGPIDVKCPSCGNDISYVLEDVAGGEGLAARYRDIGGPDSTAREVVEAASVGNVPARQLVDEALRALGVSIGLAINILDPAALVIGGGLGTAGGSFAAELEASIRDHVWSEETRQLPIREAELGKDSALIGAAIFAADAVQGMSSPKLR